MVMIVVMKMMRMMKKIGETINSHCILISRFIGNSMQWIGCFIFNEISNKISNIGATTFESVKNNNAHLNTAGGKNAKLARAKQRHSCVSSPEKKNSTLILLF